MITRRFFPYIPVLDVNSFSKKVTGQNHRPMSCDERGISCLLIHNKEHAEHGASHVTGGATSGICFVENTLVVIQHIQVAYATMSQFLLFPLYITHPSDKLS